MDYVPIVLYGPHKVSCHDLQVFEGSVTLMSDYSIANAKVSGMDEDLNLTSNQYSVALVVYFVGYVVFEVPSK